MRRRKTILSALVLFAGTLGSAAGDDFAAGDFEALHQLVLPSEGDSQWMSVSWMSATDIWAARKKAAAEGKPIFLWYMAGEPLGPC